MLLDAAEFDDKIDLALSELDDSIKELITGDFAWQEVTTFLKKSIQVAERLLPLPGSGVDKKALVMSVWDYYDEQYQLTEKMDRLIEFEKIIGKPLGAIFEIWDGRIIKNVIEYILIPFLVSLVFPKKAIVEA